MGFGDFDWICQRAPIPLCSLVGKITYAQLGVGIEADCYARNIEVANTIIFQGATSFVHISALIMTIIMLLHVRSKFTAVGMLRSQPSNPFVLPDANILKIGRREITTFFYLYMLLTFISLCIDSGVVPPGSEPYPYFTAVQSGLTSALCVCLLINGFVGFQLYEDGTPLSVWLLRSISFAFFAITFLVSLATFKSWAGSSPTNTIGLFVMLYLVSGICLIVYVIMQFILVFNTLQDHWPLGDIAFGTFFLIAGQVILYAFSNTICDKIQHYLDGLFFATICNLLAVMMVYKVCALLSRIKPSPFSNFPQYWDSITREDLEFSVGTKTNNWEVKGLLPEDDGRRNTVYQDADYASSFTQPNAPPRNSNYGGFNY